MKKINIKKGDKFGKLSIIKEVDRRITPIRPKGFRCFQCRCICGKETVVDLCNLRSHRTMSCGCYMLKKAKKNLIPQFTHRMSKTKTYQIWAQMKQRCNNKNCKSYSLYGGRGIKVCDKWNNSFEEFLKDMGEKPNNLTLDRIDNNHDYCKKNCRWVTMEVQERNRRNNLIIEYGGERLCATAWSTRLGKNKSLVSHRIKKGWTINDSVSIPVLVY